jgi:2-oxo-4-hydroxy-4-carboxy-5-ureidoimidazoline decarboxylase
MNKVLARWNDLPLRAAADEILPCCGSRAWARGVASGRPVASGPALLTASDVVWWSLDEADWLEAFRSHPRIGERTAEAATARSAGWSSEEQKKAGTADEAIKASLAAGNREYEQRFGRTFIVCATNKSGEEILKILRRRLRNDEAMELREAAEQQRQITRIRLKKWLES